MGQTLLMVDHHSEHAEQVGAPFTALGWDVRFTDPGAEDTIDFIAESKPLAAVFCLDCGDPAAHGRLASRILDDARTLRPLMVFLGGRPDVIDALKSEVPVGVFVHEEELPWVIKHLVIKL